MVYTDHGPFRDLRSPPTVRESAGKRGVGPSKTTNCRVVDSRTTTLIFLSSVLYPKALALPALAFFAIVAVCKNQQHILSKKEPRYSVA